jgi:hypothetical protein
MCSTPEEGDKSEQKFSHKTREKYDLEYFSIVGKIMLNWRNGV